VVIEKLRSYSDQSPYLRGIIASLGFAQIGIPYDRHERLAGRSKFNFAKALALSIDGICSQSTKPLHYITIFGFVTSFISILLAIAYFLLYLFSRLESAPGFTTLVLLVLVSIGVNAAFIGLLGEYIGRIYNNVRGAPTTIIADRIDRSTDPSQVSENQTHQP
jgi:polyisoprenyl-phosphate glycosyltransferase